MITDQLIGVEYNPHVLRYFEVAMFYHNLLYEQNRAFLEGNQSEIFLHSEFDYNISLRLTKPISNNKIWTIGLLMFFVLLPFGTLLYVGLLTVFDVIVLEKPQTGFFQASLFLLPICFYFVSTFIKTTFHIILYNPSYKNHLVNMLIQKGSVIEARVTSMTYLQGAIHYNALLANTYKELVLDEAFNKGFKVKIAYRFVNPKGRSIIREYLTSATTLDIHKDRQKSLYILYLNDSINVIL